MQTTTVSFAVLRLDLGRKSGDRRKPAGGLNDSASRTTMIGRCLDDSATEVRDLHSGVPVWAHYAKPSLPTNKLSSSMRTDVVVVGAGITGALVAEAATAIGLDNDSPRPATTGPWQHGRKHRPPPIRDRYAAHSPDRRTGRRPRVACMAAIISGRCRSGRTRAASANSMCVQAAPCAVSRRQRVGCDANSRRNADSAVRSDCRRSFSRTRN